MNISLDFDDTYTRDPALWDQFARSAIYAGHNVYLVTMRFPEQGDEVYNTIGKIIKRDNIHFTCHQGKRAFMWSKGIRIDVWIDDMPDAIVRGIEQVNDGKIILP